MPRLLCPNCDASMQAVQRTGVKFDIRPQCRGVWLDRGELEKLMEIGRRGTAPPADGGPFQPRRDEDDDRRWRDDDRRRTHPAGHKRRRGFDSSTSSTSSGPLSKRLTSNRKRTMNHLRTYALMAGLTALFVGAGYLIGGPTGMLIALVFAGAMNLISYWNADKLVLRMYGAEEVDETHPSQLVRAYVQDVRELAQRAGLPQPRVCIMQNDQPNAFATGRDPRHATVAATTGLLGMLDRREVRGVMAHELAHVKNHDTLTMTITATIAGAIGALANFAMFFGGGGGDDRERPTGIVGAIAIAILGPIAAMLVQMAISRTREYEADRIGSQISGDPDALASALQRIDAYARGVPNAPAERNPATAHMFIINPLAGHGRDSLFSTHPATENRVEALMKLAAAVAGPRRTASVAVPAEAPLPSRRPGSWGGARSAAGDGAARRGPWG